MKLAGKVALVTGAGRGIGRAIALRLAQDGATLVVHYGHSRQGADEVAGVISERGGNAIAMAADLTERTDIEALFRRIDQELGNIDIIVNCAGLSKGGPLHSVDEADVKALLAVNLLAPLYVASEAAKRIRSGGRIVNISSNLAKAPMAGSGIYSASKAALESFTESWAKELGRKGVTVNTVIPGPTSPGMMDSAPPGYLEAFAKASPFGRIGQADEIAAVVAFLCSPEASWVSGAKILADGATSV